MHPHRHGRAVRVAPELIAVANVVVIGGLRRVDDIFNISSTHSDLYDDLRHDIDCNSAFVVILDRLESGDASYAWDIRVGLVFFDDPLYMPASSPMLHHLCAFLIKEGEEALLRQVVVGFHTMNATGMIQGMPTSMLCL